MRGRVVRAEPAIGAKDSCLQMQMCKGHSDMSLRLVRIEYMGYQGILVYCFTHDNSLEKGAGRMRCLLEFY